MLTQAPETEFSKRQSEVLSAALDLMVETGDGFTMNGVAARANCSKETLYKWFGDRDGLLTATVRWQASKVKIDAPTGEQPDRAGLQNILERFAERWLTVLSGDVSVALNRLAVSHAASSKSDLGTIVLQNGPFAMAARLKPILELGREAGVIEFTTADEAFRSFFGLVVRDMQIRALLGDERDVDLVDVKQDAKRATQQFFALYGAEQQSKTHAN